MSIADKYSKFVQKEPAEKISSVGDKYAQYTSSTPSSLETPAAQYGTGVAAGALGTYGDLLNLLGLNIEGPTQGYEAKLQQEQSLGPYQRIWDTALEDDILPRYAGIPKSSDVERVLESVIPPAASEGDQSARKAGKKLGSSLAIPMRLAQTALGQATSLGVDYLKNKNLISEKNAPKLELGLDLASGFLSPRVAAQNAEEAAIHNFARDPRNGVRLTEAELNIATKNPESLNRLINVGGKSSKAASNVENALEKLGNGYQRLSRDAFRYNVSRNVRNSLANDFERFITDQSRVLAPSDSRTAVLNYLQRVVDNLRGPSHIRGDQLVNQWKEFNKQLFGNPHRREFLHSIKQPLSSALDRINPRLNSRLRNLNSLYENSVTNLERLASPANAGFLGREFGMNAAQMSALFSKDPLKIARALGVFGVRSAARSAQSNPLWHGNTTKAIDYLRDNPQEILKNLLQARQNDV